MLNKIEEYINLFFFFGALGGFIRSIYEPQGLTLKSLFRMMVISGWVGWCSGSVLLYFELDQRIAFGASGIAGTMGIILINGLEIYIRRAFYGEVKPDLTNMLNRKNKG